MRVGLHQEVIMVADAFRLNGESCVSKLRIVQYMGNKYIVFLTASAYDIGYSALIKQENNFKHNLCHLWKNSSTFWTSFCSCNKVYYKQEVSFFVFT